MLGGSRDSGGPTPPSLTPVVVANHCLPPLGRFDLEEIQRLVRDERCFVLHAVLLEFLARWARHDTNPLALLDDEIDALISVLRQMRAGYQLRLAAFPQSVVLCGTCATTASTSTLGHAPSALNQTVNSDFLTRSPDVVNGEVQKVGGFPRFFTVQA